MTRKQLVKRIEQASNVYVIVEISKGNPVSVLVDPFDLTDVIEAEGQTLGNDFVVREEESKYEYGGFDLYVGVNE